MTSFKKKLLILCGVALTLFLIGVSDVKAETSSTLKFYYESGGDNGGGIYGVNLEGQYFTTADAFDILKVSAYQKRTGACAGLSSILRLKACDGDSKPTGDILATSTVDATTIGDGGFSWVDYTFDASTSLNAITKYCFYWSLAGGDGTKYIEDWMDSDASGGGFANGNRLNSADTGATWSLPASDDIYFRIYDTFEIEAATSSTSTFASTTATTITNGLLIIFLTILIPTIIFTVIVNILYDRQNPWPLTFKEL